MAASGFTYADYLLYAGAKDVNDSLFATVARGVLEVLEAQYFIFPEATTIERNIFITTTTFELPAQPVISINSITYDGELLDSDTYSWYGQDVELDTIVTDLRKPLVVSLEVGYTTIPSDLKLAIYRHIDAIIFAIDKGTDSIDKIVNSNGNTTYYKETLLPKAVSAIYEFYTARTQVL